MKWIKFSERWPEDGQEILFYDKGYDKVTTGEFRTILSDGCQNCILRSHEDWEEHIEFKPHNLWMPLPDKPTDL